MRSSVEAALTNRKGLAPSELIIYRGKRDGVITAELAIF
jgi:hypothetical protein